MTQPYFIEDILVNSTQNATRGELVVEDYVFIGIQASIFVSSCFIIALLVIFRNLNPIKTRGIIPVTAMIFFLLVILRTTLTFPGIFIINNPTSIVNGFSCFWFLLVQSPAMNLVVLLSLLNMIRYFGLQQLSNLKERVWMLKSRKMDLSEAENKIYRRYEILIQVGNAILGWWVQLALVVIVGLTWIVINIVIIMIGQAVSGQVCILGTPQGRYIMLMMQGTNILQVIITLIISIVFFVFDIIIHFISNPCTTFSSLITYFTHDVYCFRLEYIMTYCAMFVGSGFSSYAFFNQIPLDPVRLITAPLLQLIMIFSISGFILLKTCVLSIKKSRKRIDPTDMKDVLSDPDGQKSFFEHARKEWTHDNILALNEINDLKSVMRSSRKERVKEVIEMYFKSGACIEVSLPFEVKVNLMRVAEDQTTEKEYLNALALVEKEICANLKDSFVRFTDTLGYAEWAQKFKLN